MLLLKRGDEKDKPMGKEIRGLVEKELVWVLLWEWDLGF